MYTKAAEIVMSRTTVSGECLVYTYGTTTFGHGLVWNNAMRKTMLAHRVIYANTHGDIPVGMVVMHTCDNPKCVNINHLKLGTPKENTADMIAKGRQGTSAGKLSQSDRIRIKALRTEGHSVKWLSAEYGVSARTIFSICGS